MSKEEKIRKLVNYWLSNMDVSSLEDYYIDTKMEELEQWCEESLDHILEQSEV